MGAITEEEFEHIKKKYLELDIIMKKLLENGL